VADMRKFRRAEGIGFYTCQGALSKAAIAPEHNRLARFLPHNPMFCTFLGTITRHFASHEYMAVLDSGAEVERDV
jgi:hypothetical protein